MKNAEELSPRTRAEDILLGSLGYGEDASIVTLERTAEGYRGVAAWADGEQFDFVSEDELGELELWALSLLLDQGQLKQP